MSVTEYSRAVLIIQLATLISDFMIGVILFSAAAAIFAVLFHKFVAGVGIVVPVYFQGKESIVLGFGFHQHTEIYEHWHSLRIAYRYQYPLPCLLGFGRRSPAVLYGDAAGGSFSVTTELIIHVTSIITMVPLSTLSSMIPSW